MSEEIKQLQALLDEVDGDVAAMEEGNTSSGTKRERSDKHTHTHTHRDEHNHNGTVKLKYGSLIKTIEASSRASTGHKSAPSVNRSNNANTSNLTSNGESNENPTFCKNCLRLMFTVLYLIYSKGWIIINTSVVFIVIFICYSIK